MKRKEEKNLKKAKKNSRIKSWYSNRYQIVLVQRNILLLLAVFSVIAMSFSIIFVKYIISSKSLEPYVIEVEEKSGIATVVDQMSSKTFTGDETIKKYFINQFIQSSTAYDPRTYKNDVEKVRLFSTPNVYSDFRKRINVRELGAESRIIVRIKSIQFPRPDTAQIRVTTDKVMKGSSSSNKNKNELITLNFSFNPKIQLTMEERLINPLGFQVTSYVKSEEIFDY